ncbi:MAG: hypothetical protein H6741_00840 [Alphaproteobacteria bacterium]|nr:hypothetical protein [Alphaproteobacteria bacterium]MCB9791248.1 hypothetical protein [Alphaproteobacteria bacterium]
MKLILPLVLALAGCTEPPKLKVEVQDVWGEPIADATIFQEGVLERPVTGSNGSVLIEVEPGDHSFLAGKDGYIKDNAKITLAEGAEKHEPLVFKLYPEPEGRGFYGVGKKDYVHLEAQPIETVATEMSSVHGIKESTQARLSSKSTPLYFVFNSSLRAQEIQRQDLRLSKLRYAESEVVKGVLGEETVETQLWVADGDIEYDVKGLQSQDNYLLIVHKGLEPGFYAFHAQNVLDSRSADVLDKLPKELKVAFTFEVK